MSKKWHKRFIELARFISQWSKDPSTQTGAVIVRPDKTIASVGYNGFPRGIGDEPELLNNREEKYKRIIHSEMNAILNAAESVKGYTLYNFPGRSCSNCAKHIVQAGITTVVSPLTEISMKSRWAEEWAIAEAMFREAHVELIFI